MLGSAQFSRETLLLHRPVAVCMSSTRVLGLGDQRRIDEVDQICEEAASTLKRIACEAAFLHDSKDDTDDIDADEETSQLKAYFAQIQEELCDLRECKKKADDELLELKFRNQCLQAQKDDMLTKPQVEEALRECAEFATGACLRKYNEMRAKYERLLQEARGGVNAGRSVGV